MKGYKFNTKQELLNTTEVLNNSMLKQQLDVGCLIPSFEHSNQTWYLPWHETLEAFLGEPEELIVGVPIFKGEINIPQNDETI